MITVYSKPACPQCLFTKKHLEGLGVPHTVIDVTTDANALDHVRGLGYTSVPVVVTDTGHWSGFRPDRLDGLVRCVA